MTLRADDLIDRRRLRRKLTFWRVAAIAVLLIGLATLSAWYYRGGESTGGGGNSAYVAALDRAFGQAVSEIVRWSDSTI